VTRIEKLQVVKAGDPCPLCAKTMRDVFGHLYWTHSKWDLCKLLVKILTGKVPIFNAEK